MAHLRKCPYGAHSHRTQRAFLRCERKHRGGGPAWKKSPKG